MATPPSDDTKMLFKLLADGQWHKYSEIKAAVANAVPPGRAIRRYQDRLRQSRELRRQPPNAEILRSEDEQIRLGAMSAAQVALTSWKGRGIMVRGEGPFKEVRIKPGFQQPWGISVSDTEPAEAQERGKDVGGLPEVPPGDSERSDASGATGNEPLPAPADIPTFAVEEVFPETDAAMRVIEPEVEEQLASEADVIPGPVDNSSAPSQSVNYWEIVACPECGMGILDQGMHERWHRDLLAVLEAPGSTFVDREMLTTLVEGVMRQALTQFQAGMQSYLDTMFSQLKQQIRDMSKPTENRSPWF